MMWFSFVFTLFSLAVLIFASVSVLQRDYELQLKQSSLRKFRNDFMKVTEGIFEGEAKK